MSRLAARAPLREVLRRCRAPRGYLEVADVEALPYPDASFDAVLSTFGVMFSPDHAKSAHEMARVCRPGGRIGLANWTPASGIAVTSRTFNFRYRSAAHFIEVFRTW